MSIDIKTLETLARSNAHSSARQVESMITMAEKEHELQKISGMSVENLITLFLAGYTLEPPQPSISLAEFAEENDIAKKNECRMSMTENEALEELKTFPINCLDFKENQALQVAIKALEEIQQYRAIGTIEEFRQAMRFKEYFMELYDEGLEVVNWHKNGDLEPLVNFIDEACS